MPLRRFMRGHHGDLLMAEGIMRHDFEALSDCQLECMQRLIFTTQLEHESYMLRHPEVLAMLKSFISEFVQKSKRTTVLNDLLQHFTRPFDELDKEIRKLLDLPPDVPYTHNNPKIWHYDDLELIADLGNIIRKHYPADDISMPTPKVSAPNTVSSSFISIRTSDSTLPTPEAIPTPPLTLHETFFNMVSLAVDKATFARVTDEEIRYDTAYVELMHAVEVAMEIPVIIIREDIAVLLGLAYSLFEKAIDQKDKIAAQIAWEKRMRKKLKRTLRRQKNFKGYETPTTPKSTISSHESYKIPPPPPCVCHPQFTYNRYPKDRFGIYLPQQTKFSAKNLTVVDFNFDKEEVPNEDFDAVSTKSGATTKSDATSKSGATGKSGATSKSGTTNKSDVSAKSAATTKSGATTKPGVTIKTDTVSIKT